jgi:hypothetical protein
MQTIHVYEQVNDVWPVRKTMDFDQKAVDIDEKRARST